MSDPDGPGSDPQGEPLNPGAPQGASPGAIDSIEIQQEMEQSFLDYAMSVIVSRALPDVRDGLKPVHRRILWAMHDAGLRPDRNHKKSATVVGDVIGKYHPHGDQAVYDALVRMGQSFSLLHPLVDPHGNFGSPSDPPAAYRYTECRLSAIAMQVLAGIDEETVDFNPTFDGSGEEPSVLPGRFPNLLVNGSQGIAVGMATNIPTHNLGEVIDATIHLLSNPGATTDELMEHVVGPDFPTGGMIMGRAGLVSAFRTGRGSVKLRARAEIEQIGSTERIVVTEIPYQTSVEGISEKIAELANSGVVEGIREIRDERSRGETRLVIELKRDANANVILNNLYKHSPLQNTFGVNMVALVDGVPRTLTLRDPLVHYVGHQIEVVTRRSQYRLDRARRRAHIVEGFLRALDIIDEIIAAIRASADRAAAIVALRAEDFGFTEVQATEIVDMRLSTLTRLGRERLEEELAELRATIAELEAILSDDAKLRSTIAEELTEVRDEFAVARRTSIEHDDGDLDVEDLIDDEDVVVLMTDRGYLKRVSADAFRTQGRGGRGVSGAKLRDEDVITHLLHTSAHAYLLFFSNRGKVYRLKAHRIPQRDRNAQGQAIVNLLELERDEYIQAIIDTRDYETQRYLFFVTRNGVVKKTAFNAYDSPRSHGLIAIGLRDGDELVGVLPTSGDDDVLLVTRNGRGIRFAESDVRSMGRGASGVRGIKLLDDDVVVGADAVSSDDDVLLTVTERGYGKRTAMGAFSRRHRGGQGIRAHRLSGDRGAMVGAFLVQPGDEVLVITDAGVVIRTAAADISSQGRDASGVRVMNPGDDNRVAAVARVLASEDHGEGGIDGDDPDEDGDDPDEEDPDGVGDPDEATEDAT